MTTKAQTGDVTPVNQGTGIHSIDWQLVDSAQLPDMDHYAVVDRLVARHGLSLAMAAELNGLIEANPLKFQQRRSLPNPTPTESQARSRTLRRMEQAGLIERERSDRTGSDWHTAIRATNKGRALYLRVWADMMELEDTTTAKAIRAEADRIEQERGA